MAYDYPDRVVETWDFAAQCALWRERALHQAERAARWQRIALAAESINTKGN